MKKSLTIYVPTKGRPHNASRLQQAVKNTSAHTRLVFILSNNDNRLNDYLQLDFDETPIIVTPQKPGFIDPLNQGFIADYTKGSTYAVGFMGDDHLPQSEGWDEIFLDKLLSTKCGMVYGNDLLQGQSLPTHIVMTSNIPATLGYMTIPELSHLFGDNFWLDLGQRLEIIHYFPEVIIEHLHPGNGKASIDTGYQFSGDYALHLRDQQTYQTYLETRFETDALKIQKIILEGK